MQSREEIRAIINEAIGQKRAVWMLYQDRQRNLRERTVEPLEWVADYKFNAFCHLRQEERNFVLVGIQEVRFADDQVTSPTIPVTPPSAVRTAREEFASAQPAIDQVVVNPRPEIPAPTPAGDPFSRITDSSQWSRLINYFIECLTREYQQQYIFRREERKHIFFPLEPPMAREFIAGKTTLTFPQEDKGNITELARFVLKHREKNAQLCIGYPVLAMGPGNFAPMLLAELAIAEDKPNKAFKLSAQDYEISLAALRELNLGEEEITAILDECRMLAENDAANGTSIIEGCLIQKLESILDEPLSRYAAQQLTPNYTGESYYALYESPCLFWVSGNHITGNLIEELRRLSSMSWDKMPITVKALLNELPEKRYPEPIPLSRDSTVYVSTTNDQQRHAVDATREMPLTIVTGPPGTGKSQLVVNAITAAVQRGERVLFSSRNNNAVDVVFDRLHNDNQFPGVVRTGNRSMRLQAALHIQRSLEALGMPQRKNMAQLQAQYGKLKVEILQTFDTLAERQKQEDAFDKAERELAKLRQRMDESSWELINNSAPRFRQADYQHLVTALNDLSIQAKKLKDRMDSLEESIRIHIVDNEPKHPIIEEIRQFETQWGRFGGGVRYPARFSSGTEVHEYANLWLRAMAAIEKQSQVNQLSQALLDCSQVYQELFDKLPSHYSARVPALCHNKTRAAIQDRIRIVHDWYKQAKEEAGGASVLLKRLFSRKNAPSLAQIDARLTQVERDAGLNSSSAALPSQDRVVRLQSLERLLHACDVYLQQSELTQRINAARKEVAAVSAALPAALADDIANLAVSGGNLPALVNALESIAMAAREIETGTRELRQRIDAQFNLRADVLLMLGEFRNATAETHPDLWGVSPDASLEDIRTHLAHWENILGCWYWLARRERAQSTLIQLPSGDNLISQRKRQQKSLDDVGTSLVGVGWFERVTSLETEKVQRARAYAEALQALSEDYDQERYHEYRSDLENYLPATLQVFPVWGTTNLTAKSNFPLDGGLFDLVIIDEASQCDLPSALPLLYRAKRAMIIGDAQQLRHIATLSPETDANLCLQFGINREMYSCVEFSLFDMALRSATPNPGYILLEEHFRSHPEIINFSNTAFYDGHLKVLTDMRGRDIPPEILAHACGLYWVHVSGVVEQPASGSAYNWPECKAVQQCVAELLDALDQYGWNASVGIVTPYRAQRRFLGEWVETQYGDRIVVGTAHTFQGDERDVLVYSPVLAEGISDGSLNWLHETDNLLNVAVTRARCILVVIGDWEYCQKLPRDSRYRQLAEYAATFDHAPLQSITDLPLLQLNGEIGMSQSI